MVEALGLRVFFSRVWGGGGGGGSEVLGFRV